MSADKKTKNLVKKKDMAAEPEMIATSASACNVLVDSCHDYDVPEERMEFSVLSTEDFPSLPSTPLKPPPKRGRVGESADDIITKLSELINTRSDKPESMVAANTSHIAGLKEKLDVCAEVNEVKTKVSLVESSLLKESKIGILESRITELERYSRRWNLKLHGVPENIDEKNVRNEVIHICQKLLPEHADRLLDVIETVHRVGMKKVNSILCLGPFCPCRIYDLAGLGFLDLLVDGTPLAGLVWTSFHPATIARHVRVSLLIAVSLLHPSTLGPWPFCSEASLPFWVSRTLMARGGTLFSCRAPGCCWMITACRFGRQSLQPDQAALQEYLLCWASRTLLQSQGLSGRGAAPLCGGCLKELAPPPDRPEVKEILELLFNITLHRKKKTDIQTLRKFHIHNRRPRTN
ncbi:hypothetical protein QQF64_036018 [Cirrhinus molitorella]|uniref:Uncharacterized protein n=1 Tax=Cirrhinus molitorella TaxID=172907 RepID=A0ABR3NHH4_9TELE